MKVQSFNTLVRTCGCSIDTSCCYKAHNMFIYYYIAFIITMLHFAQFCMYVQMYKYDTFTPLGDCNFYLGLQRHQLFL